MAVAADDQTIGGRLVSELNPFRNLRPWEATNQRDADGNLIYGMPDADGLRSPEQISSARNFLSNFTFSISSQRTRQDWTESVGSVFAAGGNLSAVAGRDILLASVENTASSRSSGWGATFGLRPSGIEIGGSVNDANSDSGTYTPTTVDVGGHLDIDAGQDLILDGSVINAGSADISVVGDLVVRTLQDYHESDNFSAGLSLTLAALPGGSANFAQGASESLRSNMIAAILTQGALDIDVGGTTHLVGSVLTSESGDLVLETGNLLVEDLIERVRSSSAGFNASIGDTSGSPGGDDFSVTGFGGSVLRAALDGTTRATIGEGDIRIRNLSDDDAATLVASLNRDADSVTTITRDSSFDTGNVFIDVGAARAYEENLETIRAAFDEIGARQYHDGCRRQKNQFS